MNKFPTCPKCGAHEFELGVQQFVNVQFFDDEDEDHRVVDGPRGDMEWSDTTAAICAECHHADDLGRMVGSLTPDQLGSICEHLRFASQEYQTNANELRDDADMAEALQEAIDNAVEVEELIDAVQERLTNLEKT